MQGSMASTSIAFLLGVLALAWSRELPDTVWLQFLPLVLLLALMNPRVRAPAALVAGFLWALFRADCILSDSLPPDLEGRDLLAKGIVETVPATHERGVRFQFRIEQLTHAGKQVPGPDRVRLSWYGPTSRISAGDRWLLTVRLKRPHGLSNPGGFDYERWLFQRGIQATGYVRDAAENRRLGNSGSYGLARLRQRIAGIITTALADSAAAGIVTALAVGVRDGIDDSQWQVLRLTGTGHLMAISGLHIGLVSGLSFFFARRIWSLSSRATLRLAAPRAAALVAILAAAVYASLAGFALPTQRALIMVAGFMAALFLRRAIAPGRGLAWALMAVLVADPLSVLSAGFWLSFAAVAVILLGMSGRLRASGPWWRWGRVHWLVAVGLLPLTLAFFGENPLLSPLANLVAVPWMGVVVVPLVLSGVLFILPLPTVGEGLLLIAAKAVEWLWPVLAWLAERDLTFQAPAVDDPLRLLAATVGVVLLLLPRGFPGRWLGLLWLAPLVLVSPARPPTNGLWVTVLDVGQGLATVVQTHKHVLVYDTGPRHSARFDAGKAVVVPFLRTQGLHRVDTLVVSHGDNDHAGGVLSLLQEVPVDVLLTSVPGRWPTAVPCLAGRTWHWDGVDFHVLHPEEQARSDNNNRSCVLRIVSPGGSVLLPGDIEAGMERRLVRRYGEELAADVLIAPHHGSSTSSIASFLDAVAPEQAVFAVGYRNRWGFPTEAVKARYRERAVDTHNTALHGAVKVSIDPSREAFTSSRHRTATARFWNWQEQDRRPNR